MRAFVTHYVDVLAETQGVGNASEACRRAGYSSKSKTGISSKACDLMKDERVQAAIEAEKDRRAASVGVVVTFENQLVSHIEARDEAKAHLVWCKANGEAKDIADSIRTLNACNLALRRLTGHDQAKNTVATEGKLEVDHKGLPEPTSIQALIGICLTRKPGEADIYNPPAHLLEGCRGLHQSSVTLEQVEGPRALPEPGGSSPDSQVIEYGSSPESGSDGQHSAQILGDEGGKGHE